MGSVAFTKYDVALFIEDTGKTRWSQLLKEFVETESANHISRQRLSSYLKDLVEEGLVTKTIDPTALLLRMAWRVYPIYTVPASKKKRLHEIRTKKRILEFIDAATPEEIHRLHQHIAERFDPPAQ
jgi:hypothetical protein